MFRIWNEKRPLAEDAEGEVRKLGGNSRTPHPHSLNPKGLGAAVRAHVPTTVRIYSRNSHACLRARREQRQPPPGNACSLKPFLPAAVAVRSSNGILFLAVVGGDFQRTNFWRRVTPHSEIIANQIIYPVGNGLK